MQKIPFFLFILATLCLSSCAGLFHNQKQYSHRQYTPTQPGEKKSHPEVPGPKKDRQDTLVMQPVIATDTTVSVTNEKLDSIPIAMQTFFDYYLRQNTTDHSDQEVSKSKNFSVKYRAAVQKMMEKLKQHPSKIKKANDIGKALSIVGFILVMVALMLLFFAIIYGFIALIADEAGVWGYFAAASFGFALIGLVLSFVSLGLGGDGMGFRIAGIAVGIPTFMISMILFIVFFAVVL